MIGCLSAIALAFLESNIYHQFHLWSFTVALVGLSSVPVVLYLLYVAYSRRDHTSHCESLDDLTPLKLVKPLAWVELFDVGVQVVSAGYFYVILIWASDNFETVHYYAYNLVSVLVASVVLYMSALYHPSLRPLEAVTYVYLTVLLATKCTSYRSTLLIGLLLVLLGVIAKIFQRRVPCFARVPLGSTLQP
jgi:hypothetical protein